MVKKTSQGVAVFVGTRPEIIKMCSITRALKREKMMRLIFVHTGQHYDWNISKRFISELSLPNPDLFLNVGSGLHGQQTAKIIERSERALIGLDPDVVLIEGDTNSSLGVSIAASKLHIPIGHVEAGCRSFDTTMPEEINRKMIADCATLNFAPTVNCVRNLKNEGVDRQTVYLTGHPIVDLFEMMKPAIKKSNILNRVGFEFDQYALFTLHRPENTDDFQRLRSILKAISSLPLKVLFPIHPRTERRIRQFNLSHLLDNISVVRPLGYIDTLRLIQEASVVLTDSGGIQQEAYLLRTPCITLRDSTEWIETITVGMNFLAGSDSSRIIRTVMRVLRTRSRLGKKIRPTNLFGRNATQKILSIVDGFIGAR